jgi:exosome complex RNA-binding protein Rrp42 (RNase PH superfamily)
MPIKCSGANRESSSQSFDRNPTTMDAAALDRLIPTEFYKEFLSHGLRPDGRNLTDGRPASISLDVVSHSHASCLAGIGSTRVCCVVDMQIVRPLEVSPDEGFLSFSVQLPASASLDYAGPTRASSTSREEMSLSYALWEIFTASKCLPLESLCLVPGLLAWQIKVNVTALSVDGALLDVACLATAATLNSVHSLPRDLLNVYINQNEETISSGQADGILPDASQSLLDRSLEFPLLRQRLPLCISWLWGIPTGNVGNDNVHLLDPSGREENECGEEHWSSAHTWLVFDHSANLIVWHRTGGVGMSLSEHQNILQHSLQRAAKLFECIFPVSGEGKEK